MKLFGKNSVIERLRSNPTSILKVYIQEGVSDAGYFHKKASQKGIATVIVPRTKMIKISRGINNQGIMAEVDDFAYVSYGELLETALKKRQSIFFLDELNDPQNLGGILRTLACVGRFAVVLPSHHSVEVTPAVLRVACGGENYIPVARVNNLARAIEDAKKDGFTIAATVVKKGMALGDTELTFPLAVVMGSEEKGTRDIIRRHIDIELTIPMMMETLSLNVAQTAAMVSYEIERQKKTKENKSEHGSAELAG